MVTFVLLGSTVLTQLAVPALLARFGHGRVLLAGLLAIGAPAAAYLLSDALLPVLAVSAVRGVGFGILTVTLSAVIAALVPPERLGAAIGLYGLAVAAPMVLLLPGAVALQEHAGFVWACVLGTMPVLGVPWAISLGRDLPTSADAERVSRPHDQVWRPTAVLFVITMAGGALLTFLPQLAGGRVAAVSLLLLGLVSALTRWQAGHLADRVGPEPFISPLLLIGAVGLVVVVWAVVRDHGGIAIIVGTTLLAVAYGALQNLTLLMAFRGLGPAQVAAASSAWNIGYDAGTAAGALAVGAVAAAWSFGVGFALLAAACVAALALVPRPAR